MLEFARTRIGQTFLNGQIPSLIKHLGNIAAELKRYNDTVEVRSEMAAHLAQDERKNDRLLRIGTLEGVMSVAWGDYIIQGVKGEIYPCKADIFHMTYEEVSDD